MNEATIKDLEVDVNAKLSPMVVKNLVDVVNKEFARQATLYDADLDVKREEILEQYKRSVGFVKMSDEYVKTKASVDKANNELQAITKKLNMKGLNPDGERNTSTYHNYGHSDTAEQRETKKAQVKIDKLFKVVELNGPENVRA